MANDTYLLVFLAAVALAAGAGFWIRAALARHSAAARKSALHSSQLQFQNYLEDLPGECWAIDESGRFCLFNRLARIRRGDGCLGRTPAECEHLRTPETQPIWETGIHRAFAGERVTYRYATRETDVTRHHEAVITPIRSGDKVIGVIGHHTDITAQIAAETAQSAAEKSIAQLTSQSPAAFIDWDVDFRIRSWNPAAEAIFGFPTSEAVGKNGIDLLFPVNERTAVEAAWRKVQLDRTAHPLHHAHHRPDGSRRMCEWNHTASVDSRGALTGMTSFVEDVTVRWDLEAQLRHMQRLDSMGQLACGLAQELNHLFTPAIIHLDLLENAQREFPGLRDQVKPVREAVTQAIGLGQRILALGRNSDTEPTVWQPLNPHVRDTVELLRRTLDSRLRVIVLLSPDLPPLPLQPALITQIVINLLGNARDALLERLEHAPGDWKPIIRVSTSTLMATDRGGIGGQTQGLPRLCQCIEISDTGSGMSEAVQQRIFEPFFSTKAPGRGTGLGLPITRKGVQALGGWIEFESTPGEGTTFRVYLPSPKPVVAPSLLSAPAPAMEAAGPGRHILLAEDDDMVASALTIGLQRSGHRVTAATDGAAALALIRLEPTAYDLVVTDLNMPNLGGRDLLAALSRDGIAVPVVVLSGYITSAILEELRSLGAAEVLRKPIRVGELLTAIRRNSTHLAAS
ncbi:MAG: response regulator [Opitutaceae bacterium]|nr:response regulator [Opitutaceae bacterium]